MILNYLDELDMNGYPKFKDNHNNHDYSLMDYSRKFKVDLIDIDYINNKKIRPIYYYKINEYYQRGYCIAKDDQDTFYLFVNNTAFFTATINQPTVGSFKIYLINTKNLFQLLDKGFKKHNIYRAKYYLESLTNNKGARMVHYNKRIVGFIIIFTSCFVFYRTSFAFINAIFYFLQNILKLSLVGSAIFSQPKFNVVLYKNIIFHDLPNYTIMIPLYKEARILASIISNIDKIYYPKNKLDVKFIIEEDDLNMIRALLHMPIPDYIHIIKIPKSFPRTKPKALNYAMNYIKGQYVVVYDAEDRPDPDQLLKALSVFNSLPNEYCCLQAKLNFYNAEYNLLTRFFSIEYFLWFNYLIKGLSYFELPTPLGGTSNHFRVNAIKKLGFWDAYNVTEDADLGLRIYLQNYKTYLLDSTTLEEAPITLDNWLFQRSRWIKGFFQTFFVFFAIKKNYSPRNIFYNIIAYILVGLSSYNFVVLPWIIITLGANINNSYLTKIMIINCFLIIIYSYCSVICMLQDIQKMHGFPLKCSGLNIIISLFYPVYWILHIIASYRAILELLLNPFKWNKTEHGVVVDN